MVTPGHLWSPSVSILRHSKESMEVVVLVSVARVLGCSVRGSEILSGVSAIWYRLLSVRSCLVTGFESTLADTLDRQ